MKSMKQMLNLLLALALCCGVAMSEDCPSPGDYCSGSLTPEELVLVKNGDCPVLQCPPMVCPSYDDFCFGEITQAQANLVDLGRCPAPLCIEPQVCCQALSVSCLACTDGLTVQEYCAAHPDLNEELVDECDKLVKDCPSREKYCADAEFIEYKLLMQTGMCVKPTCDDTVLTQDEVVCPTQLAYCTGTLTKTQSEMIESGECETLLCHSLCPSPRSICKEKTTEDEDLMIAQGFCPTPMCVNSVDFMFDIDNPKEDQNELTIPSSMPEYVSQIDWADETLSFYLNTYCEESKVEEVTGILQSKLDDNLRFSGGCRVAPASILATGETMQEVSSVMDIKVCDRNTDECEGEAEATSPPTDDGSLTGVIVREDVSPSNQNPVAIAAVAVALCLLFAFIALYARSRSKTTEVFAGTDAKEVVVIKSDVVETPQAVANV